ncbi:MAG: metallopeptidase, partial [Eubacterium sp.]
MNSIRKQVQSEEEWKNEMAIKLLRYVQNELYQDLRFLDVALSALVWQPAEGIQTFATDGIKLYFPAERTCNIFPDNPLYLNRLYLHSVLHCLFAHLWLKQGRMRPWWDVACDIEIEYVIDHLEKKSVKRVLSWQRQNMYQRIEEKKLFSAAKIYGYLVEIGKDEREKLRREFYTDNHKFWPEEEKQSPMQNPAREMWDKISRQSQMQEEKRGAEPEEGEQSLLRRMKAGKSKRSYRDFLRKFAELREEIQCDPDTFDLNFYTYGLSLYGDMPLIEPVETREVMKIQEFVIVLDTSYSTDGDLIKGFLRETFTLLTEKDSFFHKCH